VHYQQQHVVQTHGTDVVAYGFLGVAAAVSGVQAAVLRHDTEGWRQVRAGQIATWNHVPYLENLLALVDLAVLAVAVLVLLTTFSERRRHAGWAALAWLFIVLAAVLEWRMLGLSVTVGDGSPDSPLDAGPNYAFLSREAVGATLLCAAALAAAVVALRTRRPRALDGT
jgi:hypothetical protein